MRYYKNRNHRIKMNRVLSLLRATYRICSDNETQTSNIVASLLITYRTMMEGIENIKILQFFLTTRIFKPSAVGTVHTDGRSKMCYDPFWIIF